MQRTLDHMIDTKKEEVVSLLLLRYGLLCLDPVLGTITQSDVIDIVTQSRIKLGLLSSLGNLALCFGCKEIYSEF